MTETTAVYDGNRLLIGRKIVRCRDCARSREGGWRCTYFDSALEFAFTGSEMMAYVSPDGFCAWGYAENDK